MKPILLCFSENLDYALGWMVVHSLWQGTLIAFVTGLVNIALHKKAARVRYIVSNTSLFLILAMAVTTFCYHYDFSKTPSEIRVIPTQLDAIVQMPTDIVNPTSDIATPLSIQGFKDYFNHNMPLIVTIWILGVAVFILRLLGGVSYIYYLKSRMNFPSDEYWTAMMHRLAAKSGITKSIELVESAMVRTPMVIGHLKPMILFPIGVINRLAPEEVEAILAHEIAHVMRHDFLFNIFQSVVEALLYFHPAVWWLSSQIRNERESACDEIAIELINSKLNYAKALVTVQEMAYYPLSPALAFAGQRKNQFVMRMQRILNQPYKTNIMEKLIATVLIVVVLFGLTIGQNQKGHIENNSLTQAEMHNDTPPQYFEQNDASQNYNNITVIGDTLKDPFYLVIPPTSEIIALQKELAEMEKELPQFENEKKAEITKLEQEIKQMEGDVSDYQKKREAEIAKIEKEVVEMNTKITDAEKNTDATINKKLTEIKKMEVELEQFTRQMEAENKKIEAKIVEKKKERDGKTTVKRSSVEGEINSLYGEIQSNLGEILSRKGEIQSEYGEILSLRGELAGIRGELSGKYGEMSGLRGEISGKHGEISGKRGEISGLRGEIAGRRGEISGKRGQISGKYSELLFDTLIDDLKKDNLIETDKKLYVRLNAKEMFINDIKQPDAIYTKYKAKYMKGNQRGFEIYKRNGNLSMTFDDEN
jgi:beta-lactamase regulating signal transducer with metallopeptidase domain/predicted  nucleic acid-binding Zn-ribbon protein